MNVFVVQSFDGQTDKSTSFTTLNVQEGSQFTPTKITFTNAKIGPKSVLHIQDNGVAVTNFLVYHKTKFSTYNLILLQFNNVNLENLNSKVQIEEMNGALLQEEDEDFIVAEFTWSTAHDACVQLNSDANYITKNGFTEHICKQVDDNYQLIATKKGGKGGSGDGDDDKLSDSAIAGIVIACVVVVAVIIVHLVYFLVIKKKNDKTTSTEGDSSIAI